MLHKLKRYIFDKADKAFWEGHRKSLIDKFLYVIYEKRIDMCGSYIGNSLVFESKPIFPHGIVGIFISGGAKIGKECIIFQHVTIGSNCLPGSSKIGAPIIGDNCYIGAGAKIIGHVKIGNNCRIGANAVVTQDVEDNCTIVCEKPRIIRSDRPINRYYSKNSSGEWVEIHSNYDKVVDINM